MTKFGGANMLVKPQPLAAGTFRKRAALTFNVERQLSSKPNGGSGSVARIHQMTKLPFKVIRR